METCTCANTVSDISLAGAEVEAISSSHNGHRQGDPTTRYWHQYPPPCLSNCQGNAGSTCLVAWSLFSDPVFQGCQAANCQQRQSNSTLEVDLIISKMRQHRNKNKAPRRWTKFPIASLFRIQKKKKKKKKTSHTLLWCTGGLRRDECRTVKIYSLAAAGGLSKILLAGNISATKRANVQINSAPGLPWLPTESDWNTSRDTNPETCSSRPYTAHVLVGTHTDDGLRTQQPHQNTRARVNKSRTRAHPEDNRCR